MENQLKTEQGSITTATGVRGPRRLTSLSESATTVQPAVRTPPQARNIDPGITTLSKDANSNTASSASHSTPHEKKPPGLRMMAKKLGIRAETTKPCASYVEEVRTITAGINVKEKVKLLNNNASFFGSVGWRAGSQNAVKEPAKIPSSPQFKARRGGHPVVQHDSETDCHVSTSGWSIPERNPSPGTPVRRRIPGTHSAPSSLERSPRLPRQAMHHPHLSRSDLSSSRTTRDQKFMPLGGPVFENDCNYDIYVLASPLKPIQQVSQSDEMRPINIFINDVAVNASRHPATFMPPYKLRSFARRLQYTNQEVDELLQTTMHPGDEEGGKYYSDKMHRMMISWKNKCQLRGESDLEHVLLQHLNASGLSSLTDSDVIKPPSAASRVNPYVSRNIVSPELYSTKSYSPSHEDDSGFHSGVSTISAKSQVPGNAEGRMRVLSAPGRQSAFQPAPAIALPTAETLDSAFYAEIPRASTRRIDAHKATRRSFDQPKATMTQTSSTQINSVAPDVLDLAHKRIADEQFLAIAPQISKRPHTSKILLNGNQIRCSASIAALAEIISASSATLKTLDVSGNKIGDHGWISLLPSLSKCAGLETLSLSNCNLTAAAIPSLHNITGIWPQINAVDVSCNDLSGRCGESTAAWVSLANRVAKLNVSCSRVCDLEANVFTTEFTNGMTSKDGIGRPHLPLYVHDPLLNGIYIGPGGGQLRHGPVKMLFPVKCVKKATWINWPSLTFFGRSLSFSGHEITMGPGIEIGPSQEFDEPITVVVYDARIASNQEPIVLMRQSLHEDYTDLSDKAKLNSDGAYLMFTTIHFTQFRCAYCEKTAEANESLGRTLKEFTSEDITVMLNQFDRKQVLVFTAEYLEFQENYQVCLRLRSVPIKYREDEEREKVFKPSSGFLWTGGPLSRYPVVDPAEYDFHVTMNPSSPDVTLCEPISSILRCDPVEVTHLYVVKKTASRRLQGQAMCHFRKRDAPDAKADSILFYVDMPEKGGHRNRSLVVDSTGCSDYKDLPMKQSIIKADANISSFDDEADSPWQSTRFSREFYKRIVQINPTLLRTEAVSEGMLTDPMTQLLQAPQNQAPCTHNTLLLDMVKPNGIHSFEQFLSVLKNLGYEPLRSDLLSILPIGHHLREADGAVRADSAQSLAVCDPLTKKPRASTSPQPLCQA